MNSLRRNSIENVETKYKGAIVSKVSIIRSLKVSFFINHKRSCLSNEVADRQQKCGFRSISIYTTTIIESHLGMRIGNRKHNSYVQCTFETGNLLLSTQP